MLEALDDCVVIFVFMLVSCVSNLVWVSKIARMDIVTCIALLALLNLPLHMLRAAHARHHSMIPTPDLCPTLRTSGHFHGHATVPDRELAEGC